MNGEETLKNALERLNYNFQVLFGNSILFKDVIMFADATTSELAFYRLEGNKIVFVGTPVEREWKAYKIASNCLLNEVRLLLSEDIAVLEYGEEIIFLQTRNLLEMNPKQLEFVLRSFL